MITRQEIAQIISAQVENERKIFGRKTGRVQAKYEAWGLDGRIILK